MKSMIPKGMPGMKRAIIMMSALCSFGGLSLVQCSKPQDDANAGISRSASTADTAVGDTVIYAEEGSKLVAYYFHGTFRCPTCLSIEKQSKEIVETEFADLVEEGKIVFLSLNYDEEENARYGDDYGLSLPSLVLSLRNNGREIMWKNLSDVWDHAHNPPALRECVAAELREMLMQ